MLDSVYFRIKLFVTIHKFIGALEKLDKSPNVVKNEFMNLWGKKTPEKNVDLPSTQRVISM